MRLDAEQEAWARAGARPMGGYSYRIRGDGWLMQAQPFVQARGEGTALWRVGVFLPASGAVRWREFCHETFPSEQAARKYVRTLTKLGGGVA